MIRAVYKEDQIIQDFDVNNRNADYSIVYY